MPLPTLKRCVADLQELLNEAFPEDAELSETVELSTQWFLDMQGIVDVMRSAVAMIEALDE